MPGVGIDGIPYRAPVHAPTPVWVDLDALLIRHPDQPVHPNGAGLVFSGEVEGVLRQRIPDAGTGAWLGLVDFEVPYADGRPSLRMRAQLVPFTALRPRE